MTIRCPFPKIDQSDVIAHIEHLPQLTPHVLNLAVAGEAAEDMLGVTKLHELTTNLSEPANGGFDAILFSGGGNDLAGEQFRIWLNDASAGKNAATDGLNQKRVDDILGVVKAAYEDLFKARDGVDPNIPIFAHSYDFAIPNGIPLRCVVTLGPWLLPGLHDRGWTDPRSHGK